MKGIYDLKENIEFYPPGTFSLYYLRTNKLHTCLFIVLNNHVLTIVKKKY